MEGNSSRKETPYNKFCKEQERINSYSCDKKTMRTMHREKWNAMTKEEQKEYAVTKNEEDQVPEIEKKRKLTSPSTYPFDKYFDETKTKLIEENQKFGFSSDDIRFIAIMKWKSMTDDERKIYFSGETRSKRVRSKKQVPSMQERILALGDDINGIWSLLQTSFADQIEEWRNNSETAFSLKSACRKIEAKFLLPQSFLDRFRPSLKELVSNLAKSTEQGEEEQGEEEQGEVSITVPDDTENELVRFDIDEDQQTFDVESAIRNMY